jgi:hypothetical protein
VKRALLTHAIVAFVCAVIGAGFAYDGVFRMHVPSVETSSSSCESSQSEIGPRLAMVQENCDDVFIHSASVALSLRDSGGKALPPFLVYERSGPDPVANWMGPNDLVIRLHDPDDVTYARSEMDGVRIRYRFDWLTPVQHP